MESNHRLSLEQMRLVKIMTSFGYMKKEEFDYLMTARKYDDLERPTLLEAREKYMNLRKKMGKNERTYYDRLIHMKIQIDPNSNEVWHVDKLANDGNFVYISRTRKTTKIHHIVRVEECVPLVHEEYLV